MTKGENISVRPLWVSIAIDSAHSGERRADFRATVHLKAKIEPVSGSSARAIVNDVSISGMRLTAPCPLDVGESIGMYLPGGDLVAGKVVWKDDLQHGIRFSQRLTRASLSAIKLASEPVMANPQPASPFVGVELAGERPLVNVDLFWIIPMWLALGLTYRLLDLAFYVSHSVARILRRG